MRSFRNVILVYPEDDTSINFLYPIIQTLLNLYPTIKVVNPSKTKNKFEVDDETELIIFLGHGSSMKLYGGLNEIGEKTDFLNVNLASLKFEDTFVVLFSCNSNQFIKTVRRNVNLKGSLGFGDMPTDWDHIKNLREQDAFYLKNFEEEHLDFYKSALVNAFVEGLNFIGGINPCRNLYLGFKNSVNNSINEVIIYRDWSKSVKLQMVELLNELKNSLTYS